MTKPTRPVLRYHGGKWKLAPWILGFLPPHHTYVEPFGGAASVLMLKPRSHGEVYNDRDDEVVNVFRVLRDAGGGQSCGAASSSRLSRAPSSRPRTPSPWMISIGP